MDALRASIVAHHLWDPGKRAEDANYRMPADVATAVHSQNLIHLRIGSFGDYRYPRVRVPEHDDHGFRGNVIANSSAS
jgi:hypothetical protein